MLPCPNADMNTRVHTFCSVSNTQKGTPQLSTQSGDGTHRQSRMGHAANATHTTSSQSHLGRGKQGHEESQEQSWTSSIPICTLPTRTKSIFGHFYTFSKEYFKKKTHCLTNPFAKISFISLFGYSKPKKSLTLG